MSLRPLCAIAFALLLGSAVAAEEPRLIGYHRNDYIARDTVAKFVSVAVPVAHRLMVTAQRRRSLAMAAARRQAG